MQKIVSSRLHDVVREIKEKQLETRLDTLNRIFFDCNWLKFIFLCTTVGPLFRNIVLVSTRFFTPSRSNAGSSPRR